MGHQCVVYLCTEVSTVNLEELTGDLRTVIRDDVVGYAEAAHEALDELDGGPSQDGAHGLHLCPLGEFVDVDVEVAEAPRGSRKRPQYVQPLDRKRAR